MDNETRLALQAKSLTNFLNEKGWSKNTCVICSKNYYEKNKQKKNTGTCNLRNCSPNCHAFKELSKRKNKVTPLQGNSVITKYFLDHGYTISEPRNVSSPSGQTDLVVAGVQTLDRIWHQNQKTETQKVFVSQPSIRMKFRNLVESCDGTSSSFVNICSLQTNATFADHLQALDLWLSALSKIGLNMSDCCLPTRVSKKNWGTGEFTALELFIVYGGMEIGDASYFIIPKMNGEIIAISDIGFGLERIIWAANKNDSYFELMLPFSLSNQRQLADACRTATLLALCGVKATNKGAGLQLRRLTKYLISGYSKLDMAGVVSYYYNYWSQFITPNCSEYDAYLSIRTECERVICQRVSKILSLPSPRNETVDSYFERMVHDHGKEISKLRKALSTCAKG